MVTVTLLVCASDDTATEKLVKRWKFYSTTDVLHGLDLPALSTLERLKSKSNDDAKAKLGFALPNSGMGIDPFEVFKKFYRFAPHFSRVEL